MDIGTDYTRFGFNIMCSLVRRVGYISIGRFNIEEISLLTLLIVNRHVSAGPLPLCLSELSQLVVDFC